MLSTKTIKFFYFVFLLFLFCQSFLFSQANFEIIGGGASDEHGVVVELTSDGGYIVGGSTESFGSLKMYLIKINSIGDIEWSKTYYPDGDARIHGVKQTAEGDYYLIAWMNGGFGFVDILVMKINSSGDVLWSRNFGGIQADEPRGLSITNDGGIIVSGYEASFGFGSKDIQLIRMNANGDIVWAKTLGNLYEDHNSRNLVTSEGNYLFSGMSDFTGFQNWTPTLIKTDSLGNVIWEKCYPGINEDWTRSLIEHSNGGYLIAGNTTSFGVGQNDIYVIKTDTSGNVEWAKAIGGPQNDLGYSIAESGDGNIVICGYTRSFGFGGADAFLLKLHSTGELLWMHTFGGLNDEHLYDIKLANDAGFIMTGRSYTNSFGASDVYTVKTNPLGETSCGYLSVEPIITDVSLNPVDLSFGEASIISVNNTVSVQTTSQNSNSLILCRVVPVELGLFDYNLDNNSVTLFWETVTELNNLGFTVLRNDEEIGFIPGSGSTTEPRNYSFVDENVNNGIYTYSLIQVDFDGTSENIGEVEVIINNIPTDYSLSQNYPNPFNPSTVISFAIPVESSVTIKVFDLIGNEIQELVHGRYQAGKYNFELDMQDYPSGMYIYSIQTESYNESKKMMLMK